MSPRWDIYGALPDLIILLRERGYAIGTEQCVAAQRLLVALAASGNGLNNPRRLGTLLAPVFSTSPEEQKSFPQICELWLSGRTSPRSRIRRMHPRGPDTEQHAADARNPARRSGALRSKTFLIGLLVVAVLALIAAVVLLGGSGTLSGAKGGGGQGDDGSELLDWASVLWILGVTVASLLLVAAASGRLRPRRGVQFARGHRPGRPDVKDLMVERAARDLTHVLGLRRVAQELRRRRQSGADVLHIPATAEETARRGLFTPVYDARKRTPEYLVLINRKNFDDPLAHLVDEAVRGLVRHDVHIERFYFQDDPRLCRRDGPPDAEQHRRREDRRLRRLDGPKPQYFTLQELAAGYPAHHLIIFTDGAGLFNRSTGLPHRWLKTFSPWARRALLTTESYDDNYQKRALAELGFLVLPASKFGLAALVELVDAASRPEADFSQYLRPLPPMLRDGLRRWMDSYPPPPPIIKELCSQLREFLGNEGYLWLSACAVYPALQWDLTLLLRNEQFSEKGFDDDLWSLMRLPWFLHGSMPDWLRMQLIVDMPREYESQVRKRLGEVLQGREGASEVFPLRVARWLQGGEQPVGEKSPDRVGLALSEGRAKAEPGLSSSQEYVFLSFMSGFKVSRLAVLLPAEARSLLLGGNESLRELYLLNAFMVALLGCLLLLAGALAVTEGAAGLYLLALMTPFFAAFINVELQVLRWEKAASSSPGAQAIRREWSSSPGGRHFPGSPARSLTTLLPKLRVWWLKFLAGFAALWLVRLTPALQKAYAGAATRRESRRARRDASDDEVSSQIHPKGLYVLFATEMFERSSFYSMLAMFTLYLQDGTEGFGWTAAQATGLYANYLMFVYASPLVGGYIADKFTGYRKAVMIGGLFFMAGHLLLSFRSMTAVYAALTCLVVGNGFFKPNVSAMVGNLYREGSHLKDRAYNIFYMGINIGAFTAPLVAGWVRAKWGFHPAFAAAAVVMAVSVSIMWWFRWHLEPAGPPGVGENADKVPSGASKLTASAAKNLSVDFIPEWKRIVALCVIFAVVIVFWMVFHQSGSTKTYFADANTDWTMFFPAETAAESGGIISNAINPFWVIMLTFPLVFFWGWLDRKGLEPSTPTKMAIGMTLTGLSFFILYFAAKAGEATAVGGDPYAFRVSPMWLITSYFVVTLGELMLSPMGLSLVSKVAPIRLRGMMMGGWFVATAIGNKLTQIGVYWDRWLHSSFFAVLGLMALVMAVVLFLLLKPLKKAMPGV